MAPDSITEVTRTGLGSRLGRSLLGMLFGALMGVGSVILMWWNEGNLARERGALQEIETKVVEGNAAAPSPAQSGAVIHATAKLLSNTPLGDSRFLKPGPYLSVKRRVWMYQWVESKSSKTEKNMGGSETTTTTYEYKKEWHEGRVDSERFHEESGHQNPILPLEPEQFFVSEAAFGAMDGMNLVRALSPNHDIALEPGGLLNPTQPIQSGKVLVRKNPAGTTDEIGDLRVGYSAALPGEYSVIGVQEGTQQLSAYRASNGKEKLLIESGSLSAATLIANARAAAGMFAWVLRGVGFFVMWIGFALLTGPITTLLDIVPFLGSIGRGTLGFLMGIIAFVLSCVIIAVSYIAHNPIALIIAIVLVLGGGLFWMRRFIVKKAGGGLPPITGVPPSQQS